MHLPDFYKILGVSEDASADEIKASFRRLALKYHPDRNTNDRESIEIFAAIQKAYEVLSDRERRQEYDSKRLGTRKIILPAAPVRTLVDRSKFRIIVDRRVVILGERLQVLISIFENNDNIVLSGLHRFDIIQGPVINSLFPPSHDSPEVEIAYLLKPKDTGYIEIGPASFISNGVKYLSESIYIKVNPPPDLVKYRPVSALEKIQSALVSTLIIFYSFLIGYNVYQFKIFPFMGFENMPEQRHPTPLSLGLSDSHLATGTSPYSVIYGQGNYDSSSLNRILFHNGKSHDAVVLLTDLNTNEPVRNNYIRAGDDFIMQNIPNGNYYLKAFFGNDWNDNIQPLDDKNIRGGFNRNTRFEIFKQEINIMQMNHSRSGDTLGYKVYEITLYPVQKGNTQHSPADANEFFN